MASDPAAELAAEAWRAANAPPRTIGAAGLTLAQGQRAQVDVLQRWQARGERPGGWKLGLTSGRSRDLFGAGVRPFGFILHSRCHGSGERISLERIGEGLVENELCFRLQRPLGAEARRADAVTAATEVAPAFEINQQRLTGDNDPAARIADNLSNWGLVTGAFVPVPRLLDDLEICLRHDGIEVDRVRAAGHIDDHFESIARLARTLAEYGLGLEAGQRVITGAFTRARLQAGAFTGDFGPTLGKVEITFA